MAAHFISHLIIDKLLVLSGSRWSGQLKQHAVPLCSDRLIKEVRVDNLTRRFTYNDGGHLTRLDEIGPAGSGGDADNGKLESTGSYRYDSLGRRIAKQWSQ